MDAQEIQKNDPIHSVAVDGKRCVQPTDRLAESLFANLYWLGGNLLLVIISGGGHIATATYSRGLKDECEHDG